MRPLPALLALALATQLSGCALADQAQDWWQQDALRELAERQGEMRAWRGAVELADRQLLQLPAREEELAAAPPGRERDYLTDVVARLRELKRSRADSAQRHNDALERARALSADVRPVWRVRGESLH